MTKEEAEKRLAEHENKPLGYCWLIQDECRTDCVSYQKAWIHETYHHRYEFFKEACTCPLIVGIMSG